MPPDLASGSQGTTVQGKGPQSGQLKPRAQAPPPHPPPPSGSPTFCPKSSLSESCGQRTCLSVTLSSTQLSILGFDKDGKRKPHGCDALWVSPHTIHTTAFSFHILQISTKGQKMMHGQCKVTGWGEPGSGTQSHPSLTPIRLGSQDPKVTVRGP